MHLLANLDILQGDGVRHAQDMHGCLTRSELCILCSTYTDKQDGTALHAFNVAGGCFYLCNWRQCLGLPHNMLKVTTV